MPLFKPFKGKIFILTLNQNKIKTLEKSKIKKPYNKFKIKKILPFCNQIFSGPNLTAFKLIIRIKKARFSSRSKVG